jgi:hypothetical protein
VLELVGSLFGHDHCASALTLIDGRPLGVTDKEQWEPVIEYLFEAQAAQDAPHRIREAWAFDWQNHGDAAVLNRAALKDRPEGVCEYFPIRRVERLRRISLLSNRL